MTDQNTNTAVAVATSYMPAVDNRQDIDLIKKTYAKGLNDNELNLLISHGNQMGLSVIKKQIYGIKRGQGENATMSIQVGIDGYRAITESNPDFAGYEGPEWCGPDGQWVDVWLSVEPPRAARVGIYRRGFHKPIWGIATYDEFVQTYRDSYTKKQIPNSMWQKMPANQLAKCAEAQAHRKATPGVLGGTEMYDESAPEVEQVESMGHTTTVSISGGNEAEAWSKANKYLRAVAAANGVTDDQLHLYALSQGTESLKDLSASKLNGLGNSLKNKPEAIEPFFKDLEKKFGDQLRARAQEPEVEPEVEVSAETEEDYEGEFQEIDEIDPDTGEVIPPFVGRGQQASFIDLPDEHPGHGEA